MEHLEPDEIEQRVREHLAALMNLSTAAEAEQTRQDVMSLAPNIANLDSRVPQQWAIRQLYGYVDWRSREADQHEHRWLNTEQASIDRALLSVLDQSRPGRTAAEVTRARAGMDKYQQRIRHLEHDAPQAAALHALWDYANVKSTAALDLAERTEQQRRQAMVERSTLARERPAEFERPAIEIEREW